MLRQSISKLVDFIEKVNEENFSQNTKENLAEMLDVRICTTCGKLMWEGYCIEEGVAYYCTDECMHKDGMTREEFLELYYDGEGNTYWTEWI